MTLTRVGGATWTTPTASDGGYLFQGLAAGDYTLALGGAPTGYTDEFMLTPPLAGTGQPTPVPNAWPESVTLNEDGVKKVVYKPYTGL